MATKYCDHGLYPAYAAVPTWGLAQDGDGLAIGLAASATAEIVFTGVPSSGVISVLGVVLSPTWATSADNCANLLATTINASTATAVNPAGITRKSQVRTHLYARGPANGAPAGTCQIMMRQGTAAVNGQNAIVHTLNNVSSPGIITFTGGVSGAWGFIFNHDATIWPIPLGIGGYGLWASQLPFCGELNPGDVVKVRSAKTLTLGTGTTTTWTTAAMGSRSQPVVFEIDNGTVWPADGSTPVFKIVKNSVNNNGHTTFWGGSTTSYVYIKGKKYLSGQLSLVLEHNGPLFSTVPTLIVRTGQPMRFDYMHLNCPGTPDTVPGPQSSCRTQLAGFTQTTTGERTVFFGCKQTQPGVSHDPQYCMLYDSINSYRCVELIDHEFEVAGATAPHSAVMAVLFGGSSHFYVLENPKFTGFVSGTRLMPGNTFLGNDQQVVIKNPQFGGVTIIGPNLTGNLPSPTTYERGVFISTQSNTRDFLIELAGRSYAEWNATRGRPTLNAKLPDGVTPWSIFFSSVTNSANIGVFAPVEAPRIGVLTPTSTNLAENVRTITVNFLLESTLSYTKNDVSLLVTYTNKFGVQETIDTWDFSGDALSNSSESWSSTSWNGQTWNPKKFEILTPSAVKAETEIGVYFRIHSSVTNDTQGVIICPQVILT